jgi:hypothetical protein
MARIRRPSPSMIVALAALAVALGGTSYAAVRLPRNSVGRRQLRDNSVTSPKVEDGSLTARDFGAGELPRGPQGPQGLEGIQGERGLQGPTGTVDTSNFFDKAASDARFLGIGATAADSSKLGGFPAAGFMKGGGSRNFSGGFTGTIAPGTTSAIVPGVGSASVSCTSSGTNAATSFQFNPGVSGQVWTDSGGTNPTFEDLGQGAASTPVPTTTTDHVELAVQTPGTFSDIDVWVRVSSGCTSFFRVDRVP